MIASCPVPAQSRADRGMFNAVFTLATVVVINDSMLEISGYGSWIAKGVVDLE